MTTVNDDMNDNGQDLNQGYTRENRPDLMTLLSESTTQSNQQPNEQSQSTTQSASSQSNPLQATKSNISNFDQTSTKESKMQNVRQIRVPNNRFSPLKKHWLEICTPIVERLKLQIRMNLKRRTVELRIDPALKYTDSNDPENKIIETPDGRKLTPLNALQKAADFVIAFLMGFDLRDAIALIRLDDIYIDSFKVTDVKPLSGDNLSRAIGRIAGVKGSTLYTIENATRTRVVLTDDSVHILGSVNNIAAAKRAICDLILGSPPGKVYSKLRAVAARMKETF